MPEDDDRLEHGIGRAVLALTLQLTLVGMVAAYSFSQMPDQPAIAAALLP